MGCNEQPLQGGTQEKIESSVVIPVFNQWELTRACLKALAATTRGKSIEVIVVDNASSDATPDVCPVFGKQLFGDAFRYFRCTSNRNFGPASNLGARMAVGEYLVFLNNDTIPQPGWYQPLIDDFSKFPDIAATGPLLVYPECEPFGHMVQHLGVSVSPFVQVGHLYEGIPASSPLVRKRRFFQIITGACMVIPRKLFIAAGLFDEQFKNGFEDVDLCVRLWRQGRRMTVNPEAKVVHYASRTPGRHKHEEANAGHLFQKCRDKIMIDQHVHLKNDGMFLRLGQWLKLHASLPSDQCRRLDALAAAASYEELKALLVRFPFWENGRRRLLALCPTGAERTVLQSSLYRLYPGGDTALEFYISAAAAGDRKQASIWFDNVVDFCKPLEEYAASAQSSSLWCEQIGLADIAVQYAEWLAHIENFDTEHLRPFLAKFWHVLVTNRTVLRPNEEWAYTAWRYNVDLPRRERAALDPVPDDGTAFSILMPVYNPKIEYLTAALDSVLAQDYPHWELCIADDASTDAEVTAVLTRYAAQDARIRCVRREENGHIAAATNTALAMARNPWVVLLDQDDLLTPDALGMVARAVAKHPDGLLFFSDEDKIDDRGCIFNPHFKNGKWDRELLLCQNYICHLAVYRTDRLRALGGMKEGFRSSQDHELVLRYTAGTDPATLIHIPHVLYHWRAHAESTATRIDAKGEAVGSARRAAQTVLDDLAPGATVCTLPGSQWGRVRYPLPAKLPLVTLVCDMGEALPLLKAQLAALHTGTAYSKVEILVLHSEACPEPEVARARRIADGRHHVRLLALPAGWSQARRLEHARRHAHGQVLGFLSAGVEPVSEGWLEDLVACLWRDDMAACGGKVISRGGTMAHGGLLVDAEGRLKEFFKGVSVFRAIWFGWNKLARTVDALDGLCFFTKSELLEQAGGFDASLPESSIQDYCLRLGERGLHTVWWPHAEFMLSRERTAQIMNRSRIEPVFQERWANRLTPCNENLVIEEGRWALYGNNAAYEAQPVVSSPLPETGGKGDFSAEDYLALYPDVRACGMDPLTHYLHHGIREGRKPCRSRIDYSRLTPERIAAFQAAPKGNIVVCTSLVGNYDRLLPPAFLNDGWRYVCYTDDDLPSYGIWEFRPIPYRHDDPTRRSRWVKLHLPELFPDADWVFWIDSNIVIAEDLSPLLTARERKFPLYSMPHPARTCIYEEAAACIVAKKDNQEIIKKQITEYAMQGMPKNFGLFETGIFLLNPKHKDAKKLFSEWWYELNNYSKRDQISLPYVLYKNNIIIGALFPGNISGRRYSGIHVLTHAETRWIVI